MSGTDNQTKLQFTLEGRILDVDVGLQTTVGGPDGWTFTGEAAVRRSLSELIVKLQNSEASGKSWFDDGVLPADVSVDSLTFSYQSQPSLFAIRSDISVEITSGPAFKLAFVFAKISDDLLVGVCTRGSMDLSSVVGSKTGIIGQFLGGLHLDRIGVYYASAQIDAIDGSLLKLADGGTLAFATGPSFSARFDTAQSYTDIALPPPAAGKEAPKEDMPPAARNPASLMGKPEAGAAEPQPKSGGPLRYWKKLDKTIGPLQFRRIGGEWYNGKLGILLDAAVTLAGLKIGLAGLCVKVAPAKLSKLKFGDLEFGLDGLELSFGRGPVSISGALLKTLEGGRVGYAGQASIRAATFSIAAIGA